MEPLHTAPLAYDWPDASYFDDGTASAQQRLAELELVDRADWFELYRRKSDASHWRLDVADKYAQRFLVRVHSLDHWASWDASAQHKALLLAQRGGLDTGRCMQMGCNASALRASAFCLDHSYAQGIRK